MREHFKVSGDNGKQNETETNIATNNVIKFNEIRGEREHSFGDMKNNFPSCFMVSVL